MRCSEVYPHGHCRRGASAQAVSILTSRGCACPEGLDEPGLLGHMSSHSYKNLKTIRFEGELLPNWAQLLDLASRSCPVPEETRQWFSSLTNSNGVDDAKTALTHCQLLLRELQTHRESVFD
jgi:hypothetical protein